MTISSWWMVLRPDGVSAKTWWDELHNRSRTCSLRPDFINLSQFNRHTLSAANTAIGIVQDWLLIQPSLFEKESVALAHFECQHWDENPWMFDLNLQNSKFPFNRLSTWISSPAFSLKRFHIFNHVLGPPKTTWICIIFLSYVVWNMWKLQLRKDSRSFIVHVSWGLNHGMYPLSDNPQKIGMCT